MTAIAAPLISSMLVGGTAAGAGTAAAGTAVAGSTLGTIIQGGLTLLSVVSGLDAADQEASVLRREAADAEEDAVLEQIQGLERRTSIKREAQDAAGEAANAYAAGGQDLTFGSPVQTRKEIFRETDAALQADSFTQDTRVNRLRERAVEKRKSARAVRRSGKFKAFGQVGQFALSTINRG
ncbi:MAG: hypothetical protein AAF478_03485 [Pseudomonadota bacterium]